MVTWEWNPQIQFRLSAAYVVKHLFACTDEHHRLSEMGPSRQCKLAVTLQHVHRGHQSRRHQQLFYAHAEYLPTQLEQPSMNELMMNMTTGRCLKQE